MEANDETKFLPVEILVSAYRSFIKGVGKTTIRCAEYAPAYSLSSPGPRLILFARVHQAARMAEAMDGRDASGLRPGGRREKREDEILQWWRDYRAIASSGSRGLEVRDQSDGSNRYGVIPWEVPLRDEGSPVVGEQQQSEAVHNGYTFVRIGSRRQRDMRLRANRER